MTSSGRRALRFGAVSGGVLVCVAIVGRASRARPWQVEEGSGDSRLPIDTLGTAAFSSLAVIGVFLFGVMIWLQIANRSERPSTARSAPWYQQLASLLALMGLLVLLAQFRPDRQPERRPPPTASAAPLPEVANRPEPRDRGVLEDRWAALAAALATAAAIGVYLAVDRRRARSRRVESFGDPEADAVGDAVGDALDETIAELDPRAAIIAAFAAMERGFAHAGTPRASSETVVEYVRRILRPVESEQASLREPVERLTAHYLDARYSEHPLDAAARLESIEALRTIRDAIAGRGAVVATAEDLSAAGVARG